MVNIETKYLTKNPCYTSGRTIQVKGLMLHSVGCPQPNPDVFVSNWNSSSYSRACVHGFIGSAKAVLTLPCLEATKTSKPGVAHRAWHCGSGKSGSGNNTHIGIEMCEPGNIKYTGGSTFTCSNKTEAVAFMTKVTQNAVELFAKLCIYHNLNPLGKNVIISHREGHSIGIASDHGDPEHCWNGLGMNYNMDKFRQDVANKVNELKNGTSTTPRKDDSDMTVKEFSEKMTAYRATLQTNACNVYSKEARDWAVSNGLVAGSDTKLPNGETNYMWADLLSREQFVTVLYRFAKKNNLL